MKWSDLSEQERNGLVHEKVMRKPIKCMGRAVTTMVKNPSRVIGEYFEYATWHCAECRSSGSSIAPDEHNLPGEIPHYSTDMNAAMQIPTHEKFSHAYFSYVQASPLSHWMCSLYWVDASGERQINTEVSSILAKAICLAALKACGIEIEP